VHGDRPQKGRQASQFPGPLGIDLKLVLPEALEKSG
jgi:hypothetical protein